MGFHKHTNITAWQAAKLIYRTERPTPKQVSRVQQLLVQGKLGGEYRKSSRRWTTTPQQVANFLARLSVRRGATPSRRQRHAAGDRSQSQPTADAAAAQMKVALETSLRNYILDVLLMRTAGPRGGRLRHWVVAGQVGVLMTLAIVFAAAARSNRSAGSPSQQLLIDRWLSENVLSFRIHRLYPSQPIDGGQGEVIRVEYHYVRPSGKGIDTTAYFTIRNERVVSVDSEFPTRAPATANSREFRHGMRSD